MENPVRRRRAGFSSIPAAVPQFGEAAGIFSILHFPLSIL
jgi:hypothetical protein